MSLPVMFIERLWPDSQHLVDTSRHLVSDLLSESRREERRDGGEELS